MKDKENTILLLDAFDEDLEAIKDHQKRLNQILSKVHKFREIVMTCRTQFFPSEKEEPDRTGYFTGGERGEYKFQKSYLSVERFNVHCETSTWGQSYFHSNQSKTKCRKKREHCKNQGGLSHFVVTN